MDKGSAMADPPARGSIAAIAANCARGLKGLLISRIRCTALTARGACSQIVRTTSGALLGDGLSPISITPPCCHRTQPETCVTTLIVLFNLKNAEQQSAYEKWAREVDLPTAGRLPSVDKFEVLKASGLLTGGPSPYAYVEILRINDMAQLAKDVGTPAMQAVAAQFQSFADQPLFIITQSL